MPGSDHAYKVCLMWSNQINISLKWINHKSLRIPPHRKRRRGDERRAAEVVLVQWHHHQHKISYGDRIEGRRRFNCLSRHSHTKFQFLQFLQNHVKCSAGWLLLECWYIKFRIHFHFPYYHPPRLSISRYVFLHATISLS